MISAKDVQSGIRNKPKATTSILPYLRAEQKRKSSTTNNPKSVNGMKQYKEKVKAELKSIHPSVSEAELENMTKDALKE
ncbi:MAG: hypothetical protein R3Y09_00100 [Clostridia bacterium]